MPAERDASDGVYALFGMEPRNYRPERLPRVHAPTRPVTRRLVRWSAAVIPLLLLVFLGCYLGGAAPAVADALLHSGFAPLAVFALRAVTWTYFLPLAPGGASPSPIFAGLVIYLIAGLALLGWRKWRQAVIVLLLPLFCTIPLSIIGLGTTDGQTNKVKDAFSQTMTERESRSLLSITNIDYRFVVFDNSGSKASVSSVVTLVDSATTGSLTDASQESRMVFKDDKAAQMVKTSSGQWQVTSLKEDFHPGYEP